MAEKRNGDKSGFAEIGKLDMINRALVCPRRYCSGSRPDPSRMAAAHFFGSPPTASQAAGAMILYLRIGDTQTKKENRAGLNPD